MAIPICFFTRGQRIYSLTERTNLERYLHIMVEYGVYLYVLFLFFGKGEGLRNIGLYGALSAWIIHLLFIKRVRISLDVITVSFFIFIASTILSSLFSLDPAYSFTALKKDVLRGIVTFLLLSTFFTRKMLFRTARILCFVGVIIFILGLYSYLSGETDYVTSENVFLSIHYNRFGFILAFISPFFLLNVLSDRRGWKQVLWSLSLVFVITGVLLSSSRGAIGNVAVAMIVFVGFLMNKKNMKKISLLLIAVLVLVTVTFTLWPESVKNRILSFPKHLSTFNERTIFFWIPAIKSVKNKPLFGWGYGGEIYRNPVPFQNGPEPNWELKGGLHSTYVSTLFHQGVLGLFAYILLIGSSSVLLVRFIGREAGKEKFVGLALLSVLVGSFIVHAVVKNIGFRFLALIASMTVALVKNEQDMPDVHSKKGL